MSVRGTNGLWSVGAKIDFYKTSNSVPGKSRSLVDMRNQKGIDAEIISKEKKGQV